MPSRKTIAGIGMLVILVGWCVALFIKPGLVEHQPKKVEMIDPVFGGYQHLYGVRLPDGKIVPWMSSMKDKGPITDFAGKLAVPRPLDDHPGCLIMDANYNGNGQDVGFKWRDKDGDASISSRSEDEHLIACRDAVPEFDASLNN